MDYEGTVSFAGNPVPRRSSMVHAFDADLHPTLRFGNDHFRLARGRCRPKVPKVPNGVNGLGVLKHVLWSFDLPTFWRCKGTPSCAPRGARNLRPSDLSLLHLQYAPLQMKQRLVLRFPVGTAVEGGTGAAFFSNRCA